MGLALMIVKACDKKMAHDKHVWQRVAPEELSRIVVWVPGAAIDPQVEGPPVRLETLVCEGVRPFYTSW